MFQSVPKEAAPSECNLSHHTSFPSPKQRDYKKKTSRVKTTMTDDVLLKKIKSEKVRKNIFKKNKEQYNPTPKYQKIYGEKNIKTKFREKFQNLLAPSC